MTANVDAMVRSGIESYRNGNKLEARKLLEKAIELDDYNEEAWMWLSAVVETDEEKQTCLENVLVINPNNEDARRGLKILGIDSGGAASDAGAESTASNPFTDTGMSDFGDVDFTADADDSDDWLDPPTATSSASSSYKGPQTSASEYDNWVDGLNIGSSSDSSTIEDTDDDPFAQNDMSDVFGFDDGDDIFGGSSDIFGSDDDIDDDFGNDDFASDDFGSESEANSSFMSGPFGDSDDPFDNEDNSFDLDDEPVAQSTTTSSPVMSPGAENIGGDSLFDDDFNSAEFSGGDFFIGDEDFEDSGQVEYTPDELFSFIPESISATRLPGTNKTASVGSIIVVVVLVVLNLGALGFLISGLS